jgi:predicted AlkP superfamily pyrophosphatase or phosphodiesterase
MARLGSRAAVLVIVCLLATGLLQAVAPPEPPPGDVVDGDVSAGAEAPGLNESEWYAAMVGSSTAASPRGALQAVLENSFTDMVYFYKNLNGSLVVDQDDAYHVFARRCANRAMLAENPACASNIVFDHLVFTRTAASDGTYTYDVVGLTAENPVGTVLPLVPPVNPFGLPNGPGPVTVADAADPRRDPSALATLAAEVAAASSSLTETSPASEAGVVRHFIPPERTTYPYPYERLAAELDDSDSPDIIVNPTPAGDEGDVRGGHGALDVTQSRATLLVSGRSARRAPLDPADERVMGARHVDVAPTVAKVLGVSEIAVARYLNNGTAADNPTAPPALIDRQDGKVLSDLLEPRVTTYVVVIDGLEPTALTATQMPNLCNLTACPGASAPDATARTTVYTQARAAMVSQTNANHTAMLTGAYGDVNGVVANTFFNRATAAEEDLERPSLIRVDTLFDMLRREAPHLRTAAVLGKEKLRLLYDCTDGGGGCGTPSADNPEGVSVTHVRPDFLRGAATTPAGPEDCPAEPASGSGVAQDTCVMDKVIELSATEDPDFTFVNLANVDSLQHVSGPNSPAALAAITQADAQIGRLVSYLKESGKWQETVLIVTADHSFSWTGPDPTRRVDLEGALGVCTGEPFTVVSNGGAAHVYLDSIGVGTAALNASQRAALACMRTVALGLPGVSEAWYRLENSADPGRSLAANRPGWHLGDQRAGDLVVTALASGPGAGLLNPTAPGTNAFEVASGAGYTLAALASAQGALQGDHGHPGARHIPFIVAGGGDHVVEQTVAPTGTVNEGDDTAANPGQAENLDIAPTVAYIYGLDPSTVLPAASGRALTEAFSGVPIDTVAPHANRAVIFIFDGNNSVRVHDLMADCLRQPDDSFACGNPNNEPVPGLRSLLFHDTDGRIDAPQGTLTRFGTIAGFPSVTFPNHNVVGSGAYPGHHGIVGNRYYERDVEIERDPIDPTDPRNPLFFFSSQLLRLDFETLHEAVHRAFGDWAPDNPTGAFTASVNEPSARGADFASLETLDSQTFPATFAALLANSADFVADTNQTCSQENADGYGQESVLDHLGQAQGRALFSENSTASNPTVPGVTLQLQDTTGGAAHPDPKYMIENFTLTDGAGHFFGPHGNCTRSSYGDTSSRLARVLAELANHGRFASTGEPARLGETFIVLTGDHGMENQDPRGKDFAGGVFFGGLQSADIEFIWQDRNIYLPTLHAELLGAANDFLLAGDQTLTVRITDDDVDETGARRPIAGASVEVESGTQTLTGTTDGNGEVTFNFPQPLGTAVVVRADRDANPNASVRTVGSSSPDPAQHGIVAKTDFNELTMSYPVLDQIPGGGSRAKDCQTEYLVRNPNNTPRLDRRGLPRRTQTCRDGDATCDADGVAGQCTLLVGLCLVNADSRLPCTSPTVATWELRNPRTSSSRPLDVSNADSLLTAVEAIPGPFTTSREGTRNNIVRFTPPAPGGCSDLVPFVVPTRGARPGRARLVARSANADRSFRDGDRLKLVGTP